MCLILFAYHAHPRYQLILAANRDEFYARPTANAAFWTDAPQIFAGKDLIYGGTWLGITTGGRFAAVTNFRDPSAPTGTKSRGDLTKDFLNGSEPAFDYLQKIEREKHFYSGFNLLVGDFGENSGEMFYLSNRGDGKIKKLSAGIYGLSNALLDSDWHKVETGKAKFAEILNKNEQIQAAELFEILANQIRAADDKLPVTGIGIERERILSSAFIATEGYGTRSSTVLTIENSGKVTFTEKTFVGSVGQISQEFLLENKVGKITDFGVNQ